MTEQHELRAELSASNINLYTAPVSVQTKLGVVMRRLIASASSILLLSACQSPLVAMRNLSFEGKFEVNGERHEFNVPYSCHYEDVSWLSERGASWHNRAGSGLVKVIGKLSDGSRFEVLPVRPRAGYGETCANQPEAVTARLFIELPNSNVESFDKPSSRSVIHKVTSLESSFAFKGTASAAYEPQEKWAINKRREAPATVRYYTVWVTEYGKENWGDRFGSGIRDFIEARKIPWLDRGTVFPFSAWSDNDVKFAREYRGALRWPTSQVSLTPSDDSNEIWSAGKSTGTIRWVLEPAAVNDAEKWRGATMDKFKRWIEYRGSRIEIPLKDYYRLLYDKERDRILQFRVEHVDLW